MKEMTYPQIQHDYYKNLLGLSPDDHVLRNFQKNKEESSVFTSDSSDE